MIHIILRVIGCSEGLHDVFIRMKYLIRGSFGGLGFEPITNSMGIRNMVQKCYIHKGR
jgi:hypothetical protein